MHRQLSGDGGREGGVLEEPDGDLPQEDEGGKKQRPDAEDVDPFVECVVVIGGVEGKLLMVRECM